MTFKLIPHTKHGSQTLIYETLVEYSYAFECTIFHETLYYITFLFPECNRVSNILVNTSHDNRS